MKELSETSCFLFKQDSISLQNCSEVHTRLKSGHSISPLNPLIPLTVPPSTGHVILLPIHILFIDLITDSIPSIALSFEDAHKGIMDEKPNSVNKPIFTPFILSCIITSAIIETIMVLFVYYSHFLFYLLCGKLDYLDNINEKSITGSGF